MHVCGTDNIEEVIMCMSPRLLIWHAKKSIKPNKCIHHNCIFEIEITLEIYFLSFLKHTYSHCYKLNACFPPTPNDLPALHCQIHMLKPYSPKGWYLEVEVWGVIRAWGWGPHKKTQKRNDLFLFHVRTHSKMVAKPGSEPSPDTESAWALTLDF